MIRPEKVLYKEALETRAYHEQDPVHSNGMAEVLPQKVEPALALIEGTKHTLAVAHVNCPQEVAGTVGAEHR